MDEFILMPDEDKILTQLNYISTKKHGLKLVDHRDLLPVFSQITTEMSGKNFTHITFVNQLLLITEEFKISLDSYNKLIYYNFVQGVIEEFVVNSELKSKALRYFDEAYFLCYTS